MDEEIRSLLLRKRAERERSIQLVQEEIERIDRALAILGGGKTIGEMLVEQFAASIHDGLTTARRKRLEAIHAILSRNNHMMMQPFQVEEHLASIGIEVSHRRVVARDLKQLVADGLVQTDGKGFYWVGVDIELLGGAVSQSEPAEPRTQDDGDGGEGPPV